MPSLIDTDRFPIARLGLAENIGGPPTNVTDYAFNTPFGLGEFRDSYRGPARQIIQRPAASEAGVLASARRVSRMGLGILDRVASRFLDR